jgi:hypothetical protein
MPVTPPNLRSWRKRSLTLAAIALAGLAALPGCYYAGWHEGGDHSSSDKRVYLSTEWQPKTVSLIDTRSGQTITSWEVPVGKQLCLQFFETLNDDDPLYPSIMKFEIMKAGRTGGALSNSMPVPGSTARLLKMELRPVPEYPADVAEAAPREPVGEPD